ncbi:PASTA domain-containing protein [Streptomyces sp. NPDC016845]|uniref:PASTA domain-containing protein n=1 Tax=Streptomyces sp. NPDC016845 TaxID=3364972 RepID=UPI00378AE5FF
MHLRKFSSGIALALTVAAVGAGCTNEPADRTTSAAHTSPTAVPSPPSDSLAAQLKNGVKGNLGYSAEDATDLGRPVDMQHMDLWRSCFSHKNDAAEAVDFWAVPYAEKCPARRNAHVPTPKTPDVTGEDFERAFDVLLRKGYAARYIKVYYGTDGAVSEENVPRVDGQVCEQSPKAGQPFDAREDDIELHVAVGKCPSR